MPLIAAVAFLRRHLCTTLFLIALPLTFCLGRCSSPKHVDTVTTSKSQSTQVQATTAQQQVSVQKAATTDTTKHVHITKREVIRRDGTVVKVEIRDITSGSQSQQQLTKQAQATTQSVTTSTQLQTTETKQLQSDRPRWHVNALVGTDITRLRLQPGAPYVNPLFYGGEVQRRVIGPLWVGVFGLSSGVVGVSLGAEF